MSIPPPKDVKEVPMAPPRPPIAAEVRAWGLAAIAVFVHTIGIVWWAATLSADLKSLKELLVAQQIQFNDHEQRIRRVELHVAGQGKP
jgi:hypothetical protein